MAAPPYTLLADAQTRVNERLQGQGSATDSYRDELLEASKGSVSNVTHYRPFIVAAIILEQSTSAQTLKKVGDIEFTNLLLPIQSLKNEQFAYDSAYGLTVPSGYEALPDSAAGVGDKAALKGLYESGLMTLKRYSPRGGI